MTAESFNTSRTPSATYYQPFHKMVVLWFSYIPPTRRKILASGWVATIVESFAGQELHARERFESTSGQEDHLKRLLRGAQVASKPTSPGTFGVAASPVHHSVLDARGPVSLY